MPEAIRLININKTFQIPEERKDSLREYFTSWNFRPKLKTFVALREINLSVAAGEWLGIIGRNGSGKSTLLKIMAGIYESNQGQVKINGQLIPFLELGVGFNPDLSAKDNIFLNGVILGMRRQEITKKFNQIVNFAGIRPFLDLKLKNFSSGMQIRLAFAIAAQAKGNIYLLDEVLAVGDWQFQKKVSQVFKTMKRQGKTVILVSHNLESIIQYCDKAIWLDHGKIISSGIPKSVVNQYTRFVTP